MEKKINVVAAYIRLSVDDADTGKFKAESESITNQREYIKRYIESNDELSSAQYMEFVDDGYSGLNFNRPKFNEMMKLINKRVIDCIIVKDLSRFGRNYLECGNYIEHIFPFLQIRFISINNNYDSMYSKNISSIEIGFKNILSEMYSLDLSKKIKKANERLRKEGAHLGGLAPYGYKTQGKKSYKLIIDDEKAKIVKRIFDMYIAEMPCSMIAKILDGSA